jgi:hypothetical protein
MNRLIAVFLLFLAASVSAGDEFRFPQLRDGSAFKSADPAYEVIGVEERDGKLCVWVVANPEIVLTQRGVNRIIVDIERRMGQELSALSSWSIEFYSAVRETPQLPAFRITDEIAVYYRRNNRTHFMSGKTTYGGWAHGPVR